MIRVFCSFLNKSSKFEMSYNLKTTLASLPGTTRGSPLVINGDPKGKNFLYCNGNFVFIRDIEDPSKCDVYAEHSYPAKVAQYSPTGFYIASGDQTGKIRIWDTINPEHILKAEYQPISGVIRDICWDSESKRIAVAGEGREKFGHVFLMDSGSSVGEIMGHSKTINSISIKPNRPYRIVTGSEDFAAAFFEGPPFKFKMTLREHNKFVQVVRFSPNGEYFVTGCSGGKVVLFNGKDGSKVHELGENGKAHNGSIYAVSWCSDSTQLLTASGDKTAKIWDVKENTCKAEFKMGNQVEDQQVGCLWQGDHIITVSLSGAINMLDKNNPDTPLEIIRGHNRFITALATTADGAIIYTGSLTGRTVYWDAATGKNKLVGGRPHDNQVVAMATVGDKVASIGYDDKLKFISIADQAYTDTELSTGSQPKSLASSLGGLIVVGCVEQIEIYRSDVKSFSLSIQYEALSVAIHPSQPEIAVGGNDNIIRIYLLDTSDQLTEKNELKVLAAVTTVAYSPDGKYLSSGDRGRVVSLFDVADGYKKASHPWQYHSASINQLNWSPDSLHIASCSLDSSIIIWSVESPDKQIKLLRAHPRANVRNVRWLDNNTVASAGDDCCVKIWEIKH